MTLINHFILSDSEFVSEWLLDGMVISVQWQHTGAIVRLSLRPTKLKKWDHVLDAPLEKEKTLICLIYAQSLVLLSHRLSLDDPLQEAVVAERIALEQTWLQQTKWQDDRPYNNTAIPLKPLRA